jgi:uncharacterized protein
MYLKLLEYKKFQDGEDDILFSTGTCGLFRPDPISITILDILGKNGNLTRKDLMGRLNGNFLLKDAEDALKELVLGGFVLVASEEEDLEMDFSPRTELVLPGISHLVMNVSHACNLRCGYCYAGGGNYNGEKALMKPDVALSLVDLLFDNTEDNEVMITFFGGEPLMNMEAIEAAVKRAEERSGEEGKKVEFTLTTNGTLLDSRVIDFAAHHNFKLTVSVDGPRDGHDRHRRFPDGSSSYDTIVSRLPALLVRARIPARTTLTKQNHDVVVIFDHLMKLGFTQVGFAPVDTTDGEFALGDHEMEQVLEGFKELAGKFLNEALEGRVYGFTNIINLMKLFHQGDRKPLPCGAGLKLTSASPDGNIYLCHRFAGNEDFRMGDMSGGIDDQKRRELLEPLHVDSRSGCMTCWARHLCGGGCYYLAHLHNGNFIEPHRFNCKYLLEWYEYGINIYLKLLREKPDFLDKFSGMELQC